VHFKHFHLGFGLFCGAYDLLGAILAKYLEGKIEGAGNFGKPWNRL
jgi:hypothetical protein